MELLVTRQALDMIERGVREGQRDDLEHGGSLLALEDGDRTLVAYALPTGPAAEQGPARVRTDAGFQNASIERIRRVWPALGYVGDWHVHPMWLPQLSGTDRHTAARILAGEAAHRRHLVLLLGTAPPHGDAMVLGFRAWAGSGALAQVEGLSVRPIDDDGPEVIEALGEPLRPLSELLASRPRVPASSLATSKLGWLDALGGPLRALGDVLGAYQPLLTEPLLRRTPTMTKIYSLRTHAAPRPQEPEGTVVVTVTMVEQLRFLPASGVPLYGTVEVSSGQPLLRVTSTAPQPDLERLGRAWSREEDLEHATLEPEALTLVISPSLRASRDGAPLFVEVLDPGRYRDRVRALPGADALLDRTVVLVGLGSVGSDLGARLVRLGVRVIGCDPDRLAVENLIRWGLQVPMEPHVGRTKAEVWVEELRRTVPGASVEAHAIDVVRDATRFDAIVERERPALLVAATDTADSRRVVNAAAARHGTAALFVALSDGAASVRIESVPDARSGPCHLCAERAEGIAPEGFGGTRRSRTPYGSEASPPATAVAALPVDVAIGTGLATRIAVLLLTGADEGAWFTHREQHGNVLFVSLRRDTWVFEEAWDRLVYQVERDPECPVCGDPEESDVV